MVTGLCVGVERKFSGQGGPPGGRRPLIFHTGLAAGRSLSGFKGRQQAYGGEGDSPGGCHDAISSTLIHFWHRISLERHMNDSSVLYYSMAAVWRRFDSAAGR